MISFSDLHLCVIANFPPRNMEGLIVAETLSKYLEKEGATVYRICRQSSLFLKPLSTIVEVLRVVKKCNLIQVQCASYMSFFRAIIGVVIGKIYRKKVVVWYHGGRANDFLSAFGILAKPILKLADKIVVPSKFLAGVFLQHGIEAHEIPNPFDFDFWSYRERTEISARLITVKHLESIYGIDTIIKAFSLVKQKYASATLTIIGKGSQEDELKSLVEKLAIPDVFFLGFVKHQNLPDLYDAADIFVSGSRVESFGMVLLEAAASGLPIVATKIGGVLEILEDGRNSILVDMDDFSTMADSIEYLLMNQELAWSFAQNGYRDLTTYSWQNQRLEWLDLYHQVLSQAL